MTEEPDYQREWVESAQSLLCIFCGNRRTRLFRQLDTISVFAFALVFVGKNFIKPTRLALCQCFVLEGRIVM